MDYYTENAARLSRRYRSRSAEDVHRDWLSLVGAGRTPGLACDVGAGSGRDAQWLAKQGWSVVAVEPSAGMRELAMADNIAQLEWVDDSLPDLAVLSARPQRFDLILVSAVWQHLEPAARAGAVAALSHLLRPQALLVITLRHGSDTDENALRGFFTVSAVELEAQAQAAGLTLVSCRRRDDEARAHIQWETCVFSKRA
ncbi:methyltransferase type 11 [gamma proteobacterium NOR5-3]|nr:methyltransferase type 11 [gamma proteobacterium NOR5-3]